MYVHYPTFLQQKKFSVMIKTLLAVATFYLKRVTLTLYITNSFDIFRHTFTYSNANRHNSNWYLKTEKIHYFISVKTSWVSSK